MKLLPSGRDRFTLSFPTQLDSNETLEKPTTRKRLVSFEIVPSI